MTKVLKISKETIQEAADLIANGGLVAYPTDTVYGLGCNPFDKDAVLRLFKAKMRGGGALPVLVDGMRRAAEIGAFDPLSMQLASKFWPGPLTIVVPAIVDLPPQVTGSTGSIGLRVPNRQETLDLITRSSGAVVGTSANIAGNPSAKSAADVVRELANKIDLVLDGGPATLGVESTIVKIEPGGLSILREKAIKQEEIFRVIKPNAVR